MLCFQVAIVIRLPVRWEAPNPAVGAQYHDQQAARSLLLPPRTREAVRMLPQQHQLSEERERCSYYSAVTSLLQVNQQSVASDAPQPLRLCCLQSSVPCSMAESTLYIAGSHSCWKRNVSGSFHLKPRSNVNQP